VKVLLIFTPQSSLHLLEELLLISI